ncbi:MAG: ABC transporter ATP-binding protein [Desulfobacteraceae bacterium]|nr:MAG: ABC transporter ATP-binding protein [Desulfobacteraceae bacterium]
MTNSNALPSSSSHAVTVRNLSRQFGDFVAVDNVSFDVSQGEIFGFLGANGAGKTTTIRMLTGLLQPSSGEGSVGGWDINREYEKIKTRIGYMSQRFSLYDDLKVRENLFFFGGIYGLSRPQIIERIAELDISLNLSQMENRKTVSLPLGFKQRLALACAILHKPPILFLDEPTGGVDPIARRYFWDLISTLADGGTTVFVTTHYMDEAEYCHRLSIMYKGRIVEMDSPAAIKKKYQMTSIQDIFIHLVDR